MDLLKTPSVQSLLDSDLESVESVQYLDIEELDEVEYALPISEAPTLAEVLSVDEDDEDKEPFKSLKTSVNNEEPSTCSALQVDFLQAVSQQLIHAQERSSTGSATALSVGIDGKLTVGTAHGHLLSFHDQTLRWVCDSNVDCGAVSCLSYSQDSTRLLAGYARGLICQYETIRGIILRRVTLGGELWGILQVTWAGTSGLALDTGGSVWLLKFSRPLGVRTARSSCLFSGARGEVVAMAARDARILALATLSRVIIVAGGRAAGARLGGPPDTLPVLAWCENDDRTLVCARARALQWLTVNVTGTSISLRTMRRVELKASPLWLGWLGGSLAIFDADENLRLWGDEYDKPLDLSQIETVYASAFFKGIWTDGRVSRAMCAAGISALGGACVSEGALSLLGRRGVVRVRPRDLIARAQAFMATGRYLQALRLLCSTQGPEAKTLTNRFIANLSERPHILNNKHIADQTIKLCVKYSLSEELWNCLWEHCSEQRTFVEALGEAAVRGELSTIPPSPDCSQGLIEKLAEFEPGLVERVVASLPLTSLDPHRASVFTRSKGLWRGVGAIAAALGGSSGAMRELVAYVSEECGARAGARCECAGGALLLAAADALAGRAAGGRALPDHARPSARHDALHTLLADTQPPAGNAERNSGGESAPSPLEVLVAHDARAAVRLLEQSARDPPFVGPLGKQNRLRVARALLAFAPNIKDDDERLEILEFIIGQLNTGALPSDRELINGARELVSNITGERGDRAWLALVTRGPRDALAELRPAAAAHPRRLWRLEALLDRYDDSIREFFRIDIPSSLDIDELFEYINSQLEINDEAKTPLKEHLSTLIELRPRATAALMIDRFPEEIPQALHSTSGERALEFAERLLEAGCLHGNAAVAHLRNLCISRPADVKNFLVENSGFVRPEDALTIIREHGPRDAEPICLEAVGDLDGALDSILRLVANADEESKLGLVAEASELCARVGPSVPQAVAADMWTRLLHHAGGAPPPTMLLEAVAYLPVEALIGTTCNSMRIALAVIECARSRRRVWACAARVAGREAHEELAQALHAARRGLAVRGRCAACATPLADRPAVRTAHCARATHLDCESETRCSTCGRRVPEDTMLLPPRSSLAQSSPSPRSADHALLLIAPPRPDLEGIV